MRGERTASIFNTSRPVQLAWSHPATISQVSRLDRHGYIFGGGWGISDGLYASKALRRRCEEEFPRKAMVDVFLFDTNILVHAYTLPSSRWLPPLST